MAIPLWPFRPTFLAFALVMLVGGAVDARAQAEIKVNDDVNFKLGVLGQVQADWLDNPATDTTAQNLFIRRIRLMFGGQVAKYVTFFAETDSPNLGKELATGKNITPTVIMQDAFATVRPRDEFSLDAGLMFVPFSRNSLQSAASLLPIDYGANTFIQSAAEQSSTGRDTGFQARGYLLEKRLEYRVGAFQGMRDTASDNDFRYAGRVQFQFLDPEDTGFFYTGTYLGTKKVAAVAAAFDTQSDYHAYDADAFFDYPVGPGAVTAQAAYNWFDGGTTLLTIPKENVVLVELGYFLRAVKVTPVFQYTKLGVDNTTVGDATRWSIGGNYWWARHNANVKAAYGRIEPRGLASQNEFTVQLQFFYF